MEKRLENIKDEAIKALEPYGEIVYARTLNYPEIKAVELLVKPMCNVDTFDQFGEMVKSNITDADGISVLQHFVVGNIMIMIYLEH